MGEGTGGCYHHDFGRSNQRFYRRLWGIPERFLTCRPVVDYSTHDTPDSPYFSLDYHGRRAREHGDVAATGSHLGAGHRGVLCVARFTRGTVAVHPPRGDAVSERRDRVVDVALAAPRAIAAPSDRRGGARTAAAGG